MVDLMQITSPLYIQGPLEPRHITYVYYTLIENVHALVVANLAPADAALANQAVAHVVVATLTLANLTFAAAGMRRKQQGSVFCLVK